MTVQLEDAAQCVVCRQAAGEESAADGVLSRCLGCGFTRTATQYAAQAQPDLFDGAYYHDYFARAAQWRFEAALRLRWLLGTAHPASLVEAGSAGGYFLEAAEHAGVTASGVEPSETCVRYASERLGVSVRHGYFESAAPVGAVEAVCAFHVLEHVDEPRMFLAAARKALTAGGWLALEVPNIASAAATRAGGSWAHLQPGCHRWHFSPRSLTRIVEDSGFLMRRCDTVSSRHYMRRRHRLSRPGISTVLADRSAWGSARTTHPSLGDHVRLLAQLPEGPAQP